MRRKKTKRDNYDKLVLTLWSWPIVPKFEGGDLDNILLCKNHDHAIEIIEKSIPKSKQNDGHPAKRTFQAIRIEVNDEIKPLYNTIKNCIDCLNDNGRLCVITFHSLEDRAVKNAMNDAKGKCTCPSDLPYCVCGAKSLGKIITRKPIVATEEELEQNSRSKSAKLRIFERVY